MLFNKVTYNVTKVPVFTPINKMANYNDSNYAHNVHRHTVRICTRKFKINQLIYTT